METGRVLRFAVYWLAARHLPASTGPGGPVWRMVRRWVAAPLLAQAGKDVNIEHGAFFGRGDRVVLGNRSGIGINCRLHGPVRIGDEVMMGPEVVIYALNHDFSDTMRPMMDQGYRPPAEVVIDDDVWIGTRAIVLAGVRVGRGSVIGAGAVVTKDVPPFSVVAGNPARVVKMRGEAIRPDGPLAGAQVHPRA